MSGGTSCSTSSVMLTPQPRTRMWPSSLIVQRSDRAVACKTTGRASPLPKTGLATAGTGALVIADLGIPLGACRRIGMPPVFPLGERPGVPMVCR